MGGLIRFNGDLLKLGGQVLNYLHPRTKALLDYAETEGYKPPTNIGALNTYIMKMDPILDKIDLFYIFFGDGDTNFKLLNIVNPEVYKGTAFGGLTWSNEGVQGNGVNGYVDTHFNPSLLVEGQKYQLNASRGAVITKEFEGNISIQGQFDGVGGNIHNHMVNSNVNYQRINQLNHTLPNSLDLSGTGLKCLIRDGDNVISVNKDQTDSSTHSNRTLYNSTQKILWAQDFSNVGLSLYFMGASLTYEETQLIRQYTNEYLVKLNLDPIA